MREGYRVNGPRGLRPPAKLALKSHDFSASSISAGRKSIPRVTDAALSTAGGHSDSERGGERGEEREEHEDTKREEQEEKRIGEAAETHPKTIGGNGCLQTESSKEIQMSSFARSLLGESRDATDEISDSNSESNLTVSEASRIIAEAGSLGKQVLQQQSAAEAGGTPNGISFGNAECAEVPMTNSASKVQDATSKEKSPSSSAQKRKKSNRQRRAEVKARADAADAARAAKKVAAAASAAGAATVDAGVMIYPPQDRRDVRSSWERLMRWSRSLRSRAKAENMANPLEKVVIFGGGSFGTAMGVALARQHPNVKIVLLLRDAYLCRDINENHRNTRYLPDWELPPTVTATTSAAEAIAGAQFAIHAVPVQHSRAFLEGIRDLLPEDVPLISVSKGVEVTTGQVMSDLVPSALGRKQPAVFLSGPSFAKEVMDQRPTGIVAASRDKSLAREVQWLFASPTMRVSTSTDVIGVEICGALKNVLAIAAGIVEGLDLGNNAMAALIAQGCAEIRWLAEKMGAKPATVSGLSGLGDIMLTCYGSLSRNRSVGVRLGKGEALRDILASSSQVAEGVATAGVVVSLARKYKVQLPVLTAVAQVLGGHISAAEAVAEIMNLPQVEER